MTTIATPARPATAERQHPLVGQLGVDADPADGVADVATGHQRAHQGAGAGEHQPVDGPVRLEALVVDVHRAPGAVRRRAEDRRDQQRASGWAQVTIGAVSRTRSASGRSSQPPTSPTTAQPVTTAAQRPQRVGLRSRPAGRGSSSSGPGGPSLPRERIPSGGHWNSRTRSSRTVMPLWSPGRGGRRPGPGRAARPRVDVEPRAQHEGALVGARVRQPERLVVAAPVADDDQVDVERARRVLRPRCARARRRPRSPAPGPSGAWRPAWCR